MELTPTNNRALAVALAVVVAAVVLIFLQPTIQEQLAPELRTAWVAVQPNGEPTALVGPVEIPAGTPFKLHAVVEAADDDGTPVYYTEAPALRIDGEDVPAERLRTWNRPGRIMVRWFTVEGTPPHVTVETAEDFERFTIRELYRADWPLNWTVPGTVEPANDDHLATDERRSFGTQRYQVSIEIYGPADDLLPSRRIRSWGAGDLEANVERFPTVTAVLPGRLAPVSRAFGLAHLQVAAEAPEEVRERVDMLLEKGLVTSSLTVLHRQIQGAGRKFADLKWRQVDLAEALGTWGQPGDLLRVGQRMVMLYEDRGTPGVFDHEDLCIDLEQGVTIRPLGDVFETDGDGVVEVASLDE